MKRVFKLENLDCANCAAKMERMIAKIDGVESAVISFMSERLTLEYDESKEAFIIDEADKCCKKVEKHCRIVR